MEKKYTLKPLFPEGSKADRASKPYQLNFNYIHTQ